MNAHLTATPPRGGAWLPWVIFGVFVVAGVGLALRYSPRIAALLDGARLQGAP